MKFKVILYCFVLGMSCIAHAQDFLPIRHVFANQTKDEVFYTFHFLGDPSCDSNAAVHPAHIKQMSCKSEALFKPGTYVLDFEQVYFYGKRKVRCSGSKTYEMGHHKKLLIWKLSKRCQLDVIES